MSNCAYYPGAKPGKKHALNKQYALNSELRLLTRVYGTWAKCQGMTNVKLIVKDLFTVAHSSTTVLLWCNDN